MQNQNQSSVTGAGTALRENKLYRGDHYGVFTGPNGYYVAQMATDGVSHYQPANGGNGWSRKRKAECNTEAMELDHE